MKNVAKNIQAAASNDARTVIMKIGNGFISKIKLEYELKLQNCRNAFKTGSS